MAENNKNILFTKSILSPQTVFIDIKDFQYKDEATLILDSIKQSIEGKCITEGYIKPGSIEIVDASAGTCMGSTIRYIVQVSCLVCNPCQGNILTCVATFVSEKVGVTGNVYLDPIDQLSDPRPPPIMIIYLHRDIHMKNVEQLIKIKVDDIIQVQILGVRYQLNDTYMEATCMLHTP